MARPGDPWTMAELDALRRLYPSHGCRWEGWGRLLPGRRPTRWWPWPTSSAARAVATPARPRADAACAARHLRAMAEETGHTTSQCAALVGVALAAANERDGNRAGRGRALSDDEERELLAEWRAGATKAQVARSRGVSERTVQRWIYDAMAREAWGLI
ncbi:MAG: hypothetical protein ACLTZW_04975 [Paratractidigestivibacter faecalis]